MECFPFFLLWTLSSGAVSELFFEAYCGPSTNANSNCTSLFSLNYFAVQVPWWFFRAQRQKKFFGAQRQEKFFRAQRQEEFFRAQRQWPREGSDQKQGPGKC
jgi:hypothetical protein